MQETLHMQHYFHWERCNMTKEELYQSKFITVQEALDMVQDGDIVYHGFYGNEPRNLLREFHTIADRVNHVGIWCTNPDEDYRFITDDSIGDKIEIYTVFYGPTLRKCHNSGRIHYIPHHIHAAVPAIKECGATPNIFFASVTPPDEYGYVYMSGSQQTEAEVFELCDLKIFEVNENLPYVYGTTRIPVEKVDYFIKADNPISEPPNYPIPDVLWTLAENVASLVEDGDTIQLGFGGLPHAVAEKLMDKKDLGVHTEMFSNSLYHLMEAGVVTNDRKTINRGKAVCAFCWGDKAFNKFIDHNPAIDMRPTSYTNNPNTIAAHDNMVSINSALQIDLTGQICSESLGYTQFSGTGGATDFAYGAFHSKGGKGIVALTSTAKNGTVSRIVPGLSPGAVVSIQRTIVDYVVTEYGIARLRHLPINKRVEALISIAHPDFREELRKEAQRLMIW
jgi:acyl-CoA hydrolase